MLLGILLVAGRATAVVATAESLPRPLREVGIDQKLDAQVPLDLVFRDERGEVVSLGQYFNSGRPVILTLVYYECPMLCTLVLNGLVSALRALSFGVGEQFDIVTVSFDPNETPSLALAKKTAYLTEYRRPAAADGWHFLTGEASPIERLASSVGFRYRYDDDARQFAHAAAILVLTPDGRVARYFYGVEYSPRDLRFALVEAAAGRIGSAVDQLLLYCFRYDPHTGKYSAVVLNVVRLGGVLTVLALLAFIAAALRREGRTGRGRKRELGTAGPQVKPAR